MNYKELLLQAVNVSIKGGDAIMNVYASSFCVEHKEDNSPLTLADRRCNEIIEQELIKTKIPILSEEGQHTPYNERKNWEYFWLVDPLSTTDQEA